MNISTEEPKKVCVVQSPGVQSSERTRSEKEHCTEKLCFQQGMPVLLQVQEILHRDTEPFKVSTPSGGFFKVRSPIGFVVAHCAECFRAGFVTVVPA